MPELDSDRRHLCDVCRRHDRGAVANTLIEYNRDLPLLGKKAHTFDLLAKVMGGRTNSGLISITVCSECERELLIIVREWASLRRDGFRTKDLVMEIDIVSTTTERTAVPIQDIVEGKAGGFIKP